MAILDEPEIIDKLQKLADTFGGRAITTTERTDSGDATDILFSFDDGLEVRIYVNGPTLKSDDFVSSVALMAEKEHERAIVELQDGWVGMDSDCRR